jgi:hypothetical protein
MVIFFKICLFSCTFFIRLIFKFLTLPITKIPIKRNIKQRQIVFSRAKAAVHVDNMFDKVTFFFFPYFKELDENTLNKAQ